MQYRDPNSEYWFYSGVVLKRHTDLEVASFSGVATVPRGADPNQVYDELIEYQKQDAIRNGTANPSVQLKTFHQV